MGGERSTVGTVRPRVETGIFTGALGQAGGEVLSAFRSVVAGHRGAAVVAAAEGDSIDAALQLDRLASQEDGTETADYSSALHAVFYHLVSHLSRSPRVTFPKGSVFSSLNEEEASTETRSSSAAHSTTSRCHLVSFNLKYTLPIF